MSDATIVITILAALGAALFAAAARLSEALVRARAHRLAARIALRMEEEWLGELNAVTSRPGKLAFAIALTLTRRQAFAAPGEDSMTEIHDRPTGWLAAFNGRKTLLILPALIFAIAAYGASFLLPVRYASESLFLIKPRDVPSSIVADLTAGSLESRMKSMEQIMRSRASLAKIVSEVPLYKGRATEMDRMIEELRKDITVSFSASSEDAISSYFRVRYVGPDPELAQRVTQKLTQYVLKENRNQREMQVSGTREFLERRLESIAVQLTQKGDQLARVRAAQGPEATRLLALDYELLTSTYRTLFAKIEDVRMTEALETQLKGQVFFVMDTPNRGTPVVPNRLAIAGLGGVAGLVLGGTAVVGLDRKRRRALA